MVPLSTRNTAQRGVLAVFNNISTIMMSGIIVALIFPMAIMPALGASKGMWIIVMSIVSTIALPLTLIQYYFTKERITEEKRDQQEKPKIEPNNMQVQALEGLEATRNQGKTKGLIISSTATGKTYLAAFDVKEFQPKRFLYVVHKAVLFRIAADINFI